MANSPVAVDGLAGVQGALGRSRLPVATRDRLALTMVRANGCEYCLSADSFTNATFADLDNVTLPQRRKARLPDDHPGLSHFGF